MVRGTGGDQQEGSSGQGAERGFRSARDCGEKSAQRVRTKDPGERAVSLELQGLGE